MSAFVTTEDIKSILDLSTNILDGEKYIFLDGNFSFTKGAKGKGYAWIIIQEEIIQKSNNILSLVSSLDELISRYEKYQGAKLVKPNHYPVKFLSKQGIFTKNSNVFMYFPFAAGMKSNNISKHVSFEFVSTTISIMEKIIVPASKKLFPTDILFLDDMLKDIEQYTYIFSFFHEVGHQVGPWQVSPEKNERLKIGGKLHSIFGELSADLLIAKYCSEVPYATVLNIFGKIFYYGRFGESPSSHLAQISNDNDSWVGVFLLKRLLQNGVISDRHSAYTLSIDLLMKTLSDLSDEIEELGRSVLELETKKEQEDKLLNWMKKEFEVRQESYFLPAEVQCFYKCIQEISNEL